MKDKFNDLTKFNVFKKKIEESDNPNMVFDFRLLMSLLDKFNRKEEFMQNVNIQRLWYKIDNESLFIVAKSFLWANTFSGDTFWRLFNIIFILCSSHTYEEKNLFLHRYRFSILEAKTLYDLVYFFGYDFGIKIYRWIFNLFDENGNKYECIDVLLEKHGNNLKLIKDLKFRNRSEMYFHFNFKL